MKDIASNKEKYAKKIRILNYISILYVVICIAVNVLFYKFSTIDNFLVSLFFTIIFGIVAYLYTLSLFKNKYKSLLIPDLIDHISKVIGCELSYSSNLGIDEDVIFESNLFKKSDNIKAHSEDLITGTFKGVQFLSTDLSIYEENIVPDGILQRKIFKGRWYVITLKNLDDYSLIIYEDYKKASISSSKYVKYVGEDNEFFKKFSVFSNSDIVTKSYLNDFIQEQIRGIEKKFKGEIAFSLEKNLLHIGINDNSNSLIIDNEFDDKKFEDDILKQLELIKNIATIIESIKSRNIG